MFEPALITAGQTVLLSLSAPLAQSPSSTPFDVTATVNIEGLDVIKTGTGTLTVQPLTTSFLGRTVVTSTLQPPLAGVTVTFLGQDGQGNPTGCGGQTVSDAAGNFAMSNLPPACVGGQLIRYNGSTATFPSGVYASVDLFYTLVQDQATVSPVLVNLPRIDNAETIMIQQNHPTDQTIVFQSIPNLTATVYAGTMLSLLDGTQPNPFPMSAVVIPADRLPDEMPASTTEVASFLVSFQPNNTMASQPVAVSFPNTLHTPVGTSGIALNTLDPTLGIMVNYGTGSVSADGLQIIPDLNPATPGQRFGLVHFDWHGPGQMQPDENPSEDEDHPECGDPIDLSSGILVIQATDLEIRGGRGRIGIDRNYRSLTTTAGPFGLGTNHNYGHRLDTSSPQGRTVISLIMPSGSFFPFTKQLDGTFTNTTIPAVRGAVLTVLFNNEVDLRWKDGTVFHFSPAGFLVGSVLDSIIDRNGNKTRLVRNGSNRIQILTVIDPVGRKLTLSYDQDDRITSITDPIGRAVQYTYNSQGTLETVTDPEGGVTRYDYDPQNQLTQITDARNIIVAQNTFDTNGRVIEQIQADGGVWTFDYELLNPLVALSPVQATTVTDPRGNPTTFRFSPSGFVLSRTDELGQTTEFEKENGTNLEISRTDSLGREWRFSYDSQGNRISNTDPEGNVTTFEYEPIFNLLTKRIDALSNTKESNYDTQGNVLTSTNALNQITTFTYNNFGQQATVMDPIGNKTTFDYNTQGDLVLTTDPLGNVLQREYDSVSRVIRKTDANGFSSQLIYDGVNRVTNITDARNSLTQLTYDAVGNLISLEDGKGQKVNYTYDSMNRLSSRGDPLDQLESYGYDFNGNLIQSTDRKNQDTSYIYDVLDRRINVSYDDGSVTAFTYDPENRLTQITDSISGAISFKYDALGRMVQETTPHGSIDYTFDSIGRQTTRKVNGEEFVGYDYDAASHITKVEQGNLVIGMEYDTVGRRTSLTYSNGTSATYTHDAASRLTNLRHQGPTGVIEDITYSYDAVGKRVAVNRVNEMATILPEEVQANYNQANQQIQFNSPSPNSAYDANGNLESLNDGTGITTYVWDVRNRLVAINGPTLSAIFSYDSRGRRISKTINGITTTYQYDNKDIVAEMLGSTVQVRYLNNPLSVDEIYVRQATVNEYFHADALGSTLALSDDQGAVNTEYLYDPFGHTIVNGASSNTFQYTGRENDETGLYYHRARYYSPKLQRFLGEDPILVPFTPVSAGLCPKTNRTVWFFPGQINLSRIDLNQHVNPFLYLKNAPLGGRDPSGLDKDEDDCDTKGQECAREFTQQSGGENNLSTCATTRLNGFGSGCAQGDSSCAFLDAIDLNTDCGSQPDPHGQKDTLTDCVQQLLDCN